MAKILVNKNGQALMSADGKVYKGAVEQVIPEGYIKPSGKIEITSTEEIDVSSYEKAQVVDSNLVAENIVKDVTILGVTGTLEAGGGGNTLKNLLDNTKSAQALFSGYTGDNLSDLIKYNDTENVTSFYSTFYNCKKATEFPQINTSNGKNFYQMYSTCESATTFPQINTSNGTDFSYMYNACKKATEFPQINTSNGINFSYMYSYCENATSLPLIDTSNGTNFNQIYYNCKSATTLPPLNTSNGTSFTQMYNGCKNVIKVEVSHYKLTSTPYGWCGGCYSLKAVIIRSFGSSYVMGTDAFNNCYHILGTTNSQYNPNGDQDGYIYVPRDMIETLSSATNWSTVATQFRALEDYTLDGTTTGEFDDVKAGLV